MKTKNEQPEMISQDNKYSEIQNSIYGNSVFLKMKKYLILTAVLLITAGTLSAKDEDKTIFDNEAQAEDFKKNDKQKTDDFFAFEVDKLSEKFFTRLIINFLSVFILVRFIYFLNYRKKELFFTFFVFNFIIFLISFFLNKVDMGIGAAFGLFAVFAMLRYRTENISARDMTYLFMVIAIGLITAISKVSAIELVILNGMALLLTLGLEGGFFLKKESTKLIQYENIEMIKPENFPVLISDLKKRTGLNVHRIELDKVDFLKDTALIKLYYYEENKLPAFFKNGEAIKGTQSNLNIH